MGRTRHYRTWGGFRKQLNLGGSRRSVTVTFNYGGEFRTLVAPSREAAFRDAVARWGAGWDGEPCVSTPDSIYNDLTGWTRAQHGQDLAMRSHRTAQRDEFRRTGTSYNRA